MVKNRIRSYLTFFFLFQWMFTSGTVVCELDRQPVSETNIKFFQAENEKNINVQEDTTFQVTLTPEAILEVTANDAETKEIISDVSFYNNEKELTGRENSDTIKIPVFNRQSYYILGKHPEYLNNSITLETKNISGIIKLVLWMFKDQQESTFNNVYFDFNNWDLMDEAKINLDNIASLMKENPDIRIEIESYTDTRGSEIYNQWLSEQRTNSVLVYLMSKNINRVRIYVLNYGEKNPVIPDAKSESEHSLNRRVTIKIIKGQPVLPSLEEPQEDESINETNATIATQQLSTTVSQNETGTNYRIQILASNYPIDIYQFMENLTETFSQHGIIEQEEDGLIKYQIGPLKSKTVGIEIFDKLETMGYQIMFLEYYNDNRIKMLLP